MKTKKRSRTRRINVSTDIAEPRLVIVIAAESWSRSLSLRVEGRQRQVIFGNIDEVLSELGRRIKSSREVPVEVLTHDGRIMRKIGYRSKEKGE